MEAVMEVMSLRNPPGVFISMTMAAALLLCAVATTRDMNVDEPGSTGRLKSAIMTSPAALFVSAKALRQLLATIKTRIARTRLMKQRVIRNLFCVGVRFHICGSLLLPISIGIACLIARGWGSCPEAWCFRGSELEDTKVVEDNEDGFLLFSSGF